MPFCHYNAKTKVDAVILILEGKTDLEVQAAIREAPHQRTLNRWVKLYLDTQRVIRDPASYDRRGRPTFFNNEDREFIKRIVATKPQLFLDKLRTEIFDDRGILPSLETLQLELNTRLNLTLKKCRTSNVRKNFYKKALYYEMIRDIPAEMFVFTDETAICERDLLRVYGRSPAGEFVTRWVKRSNPKCYSMLPAIGLHGILAMSVREGSINRDQFETFLEFQLLPHMNPYPQEKSILVMDNCPIHKEGRVEELCFLAGVRLIYLPPYCPEFNPIEMCFLVIKD